MPLGGYGRDEHREIDVVDGAVPFDEHDLRVVLHERAREERIHARLIESVERHGARTCLAVATKLGVGFRRRLLLLAQLRVSLCTNADGERDLGVEQPLDEGCLTGAHWARYVNQRTLPHSPSSLPSTSVTKRSPAPAAATSFRTRSRTSAALPWRSAATVSYTHLTLPTNREV